MPEPFSSISKFACRVKGKPNTWQRRLFNSVLGCVAAVPFICLGKLFLLSCMYGGGMWDKKAAGCDPFLDIFVLAAAAMLFLFAFLLCISCRPVARMTVAGIGWTCVGVLSNFFLAIAIFGLVVSTASRNGGRRVIGKGYREFKLEDYSDWMQERAGDDGVWSGVKRCLVKREECEKLAMEMPEPTTGMIKFNGLQSGCCKPPDSCRFRVINASASLYEIPARASSSSSSSSSSSFSAYPPFDEEDDCLLFKNDEEKCFECESCRAAFVDTLSRSWKTMSIINIVFVGLLPFLLMFHVFFMVPFMIALGSD